MSPFFRLENGTLLCNRYTVLYEIMLWEMPQPLLYKVLTPCYVSWGSSMSQVKLIMRSQCRIRTFGLQGEGHLYVLCV